LTRMYCAIIGVGDFTFAEPDVVIGDVIFIP